SRTSPLPAERVTSRASRGGHSLPGPPRDAPGTAEPPPLRPGPSPSPPGGPGPSPSHPGGPSVLLGGALELGAQAVTAQRPLMAGADDQRFELRQPTQAPLRLLVVPGEGGVGDARLAVGKRFQPRRVDQVDDVGDQRDAIALAPEADQARCVAGEVE